jgi:hypothetical protein
MTLFDASPDDAGQVGPPKVIAVLSHIVDDRVA